MCIAKNKSVSVSHETAHRKSAVKKRKGPLQYFFEIQFFRHFFICLHNEMMNHFHHGCEVALFLKYTGFNIYQRKEFIGIHQIKIACQSKVAGWNGISFYEGVAEFNIVFSLS